MNKTIIKREKAGYAQNNSNKRDKHFYGLHFIGVPLLVFLCCCCCFFLTSLLIRLHSCRAQSAVSVFGRNMFWLSLLIYHWISKNIDDSLTNYRNDLHNISIIFLRCIEEMPTNEDVGNDHDDGNGVPYDTRPKRMHRAIFIQNWRATGRRWPKVYKN